MTSQPKVSLSGTIIEGVICECGWVAMPDDYATLQGFQQAIESHERGQTGTEKRDGHKVHRFRGGDI